MDYHYKLSVVAERILQHILIIVPISLLAAGVAVVVAG